MPNSNKHSPRTQILQRGVVLSQNQADKPVLAASVQAVYCCLPRGCDRRYSAPISLMSPGDAVKVICDNDCCNESQWMHADCFREWEELVLSHLRSCGRARSWSDKQRQQNLWTKKGYDLIYKCCDCMCGKGHIRKDLNCISAQESDEANAKKNKARNNFKTPGKGIAIGLCAPSINGQNGRTNGTLLCRSYPGSGSSSCGKPQTRVRTSSMSSTGSSGSPPSSAGTPPFTPSMLLKRRFEFFHDPEQAAAGNIFRRRTDYSVFSQLPRHQQNPYHIKMEDEGPHGNDETRSFVLTNLSTHQVTAVECVACGTHMSVYDTYPLIDGTFFLSPQRYISDLQVLLHQRMLYLNAVCMYCMQGISKARLNCNSCKQPWFGQAFVIGSMYAFDVFAAVPCCPMRLSCKNCQRLVSDPNKNPHFFSEFSKAVKCPHCHAEDNHFIRPLEEIFQSVKPSAI